MQTTEKEIRELSAMPVVVTASITCGLDVHKDKIDACIRTNNGTLERP